MYQAEIIIYHFKNEVHYRLIHYRLATSSTDQFVCVYRPHKESISVEINNDNDLNLHNMTNCRAGFATDSLFPVTLSHVTRFKA